MPTDLVKRLRDRSYATYDECTDAHLAADRIEALEAALREMEAAAKFGADHYEGNVGAKIYREVHLIVRAALGEKKDG